MQESHPKYSRVCFDPGHPVFYGGRPAIQTYLQQKHVSVVSICSSYIRGVWHKHQWGSVARDMEFFMGIGVERYNKKNILT